MHPIERGRAPTEHGRLPTADRLRTAVRVGLVLTPGLLASLAASSLGCTLLLDPERGDTISRCDFDDDCPAAADPRYHLVCTIDEAYAGEPVEFSRVCAPRPDVSCDPLEYDYASVFATRYREATAQPHRYRSRCPEYPGVQGCLAHEDGCDPGLVPHEISRRCDDDDDRTPPAIGAEPIVSGQDVLDQFCRAVFCDIAFTCETDDFRCVPCELGRPLGAGGCGDLYFAGERSTVYQSAQILEAECGGPEMDPAEAYIGPIPDEDDLVAPKRG